MLSPTQHAIELMKKSFKTLGAMKQFILMPALCSLFDLIILGAIIAPLRKLEILQQPLSKLQWQHFIIFFLLYLIFLYLTHLIFSFSHATLLEGLNLQTQDEKPRFTKALHLALKRYWYIFLWMTFASTLGPFWVLARPLLKKIDRFEKRLSGQPWGIATYFIIPVLLEHNLKPLEALEYSSNLMTKTWGAPLIPRFQTVGLVVTSAFLCAIPLLISLMIHREIATTIGVAISGILIFIVGIFYISARVLLLGSLYQYATGRKDPAHQDPELLKMAFKLNLPASN